MTEIASVPAAADPGVLASVREITEDPDDRTALVEMSRRLRSTKDGTLLAAVTGATPVGVGLLGAPTPGGPPTFEAVGPSVDALTALLGAARERSAGPLQWWARGTALALARWFVEHGEATVEREVLRMERSLDPPPSTSLPVRPATAEDLPEVAEINALAFAQHPDRARMTLDDIRAHVDLLGGAPGDVLLDEGSPASGFCWLRRHPSRVGEIYVLAVRPEAQGRDLGRGLLSAGLVRLRAMGYDRAALYVDHDSPARALYERNGFQDVGRSHLAVRIS